MKIKAINTIGRNGKTYAPGTILEVPEDEAARLIKLGAAKAVEEPKPEPAPEPEPTPSADSQEPNEPEPPKATAKGKGKK